MPTTPSEGWVANLLNAVKSLSLANVLVIFLLLLMVGPAYVLYRAVNDEQLLDRFLSSYREMPSDTGCTIRVVAERGGPERWGISTGFAFAGADIWQVSVVLDHEPGEKEVGSYCATLFLIVDKMHSTNE